MAQKGKTPTLTDKNAIAAQATKELDASLQNGDLKAFTTANAIKGEYIFDITVQEKGKVLTVYVVSSDADDLNKQNQLKSKLREFQFNFKLAKKSTCKFQYTFNL